MMTHEASRSQPATAERTAAAYRVRNWDDVFENAQSRKQKKLAWVPVPNKHDGKSFRRLMGMENGPALYGVWVILLQVASKCPGRGILADEDGPLTSDDIAMKTGLPDSLVTDALQVLTNPSIRWLDTTSIPTEPAGLVTDHHCDTTPAPSPPAEVALKGREGNELNGSEEECRDSAAPCGKAIESRDAASIPNEMQSDESPPDLGITLADEAEFVMRWNKLPTGPRGVVRVSGSTMPAATRQVWRAAWEDLERRKAIEDAMERIRDGKAYCYDHPAQSLKQFLEGDEVDRVASGERNRKHRDSRLAAGFLTADEGYGNQEIVYDDFDESELDLPTGNRDE